MVGLLPQRAFPDGDKVPAELAEGSLGAKVAGLVADDLSLPPVVAGLRQAIGEAMGVAMIVAVKELKKLPGPARRKENP